MFSDQAKATLLDSAVRDLPPSSDLAAPFYRNTQALDDVSRMQTASLGTWLPASILMKADKMAMAHSIEVRVPFLDREVYAVARRLPLSMRVAGRVTKVGLRAAAEQVLPVDIAQRPKLGFPVPFRAWLEGDMGLQVRELFGSCDDPLLSRDGLLNLLKDERRPDRQQRVWALMVYLLWRNAQADRPPHEQPRCEDSGRLNDPVGP